MFRAPNESPLDDERVFALVTDVLDRYLGADGSWSVVRRTPEHTDRLFREVLSHSVASRITDALAEARVIESTPQRAGQHTRAFCPLPAVGPRARPIESPNAALTTMPTPVTMSAYRRRSTEHAA